MLDRSISRRAVLMGAGTAAAWLASPARALMQSALKVATPAFVDQLIRRMTLEEKAGQLQIMAAAWGGGAALSLNPPGSGSDFDGQVQEARQGLLTGVFNGNGARMLDMARDTLISLWIGNRTHTATHWDQSQNLACVVAGRRRWTLFPPEQLKNLYVGPLEFTLAGQPTSLVDIDAPDLKTYPRFAEALKVARRAELGPGDALYMIRSRSGSPVERVRRWASSAASSITPSRP